MLPGTGNTPEVIPTANERAIISIDKPDRRTLVTGAKTRAQQEPHRFINIITIFLKSMLRYKECEDADRIYRNFTVQSSKLENKCHRK